MMAHALRWSLSRTYFRIPRDVIRAIVPSHGWTFEICACKTLGRLFFLALLKGVQQGRVNLATVVALFLSREKELSFWGGNKVQFHLPDLRRPGCFYKSAPTFLSTKVFIQGDLFWHFLAFRKVVVLLCTGVSLCVLIFNSFSQLTV